LSIETRPTAYVPQIADAIDAVFALICFEHLAEDLIRHATNRMEVESSVNV
jgi:hypothetical protein